MNKRARIIINVAVVLIVIGCLVFGVYYFLTEYKIDPDKIYVEGNDHYTSAEIKDMVLDGFLSDNSRVLALRYKNKKITDVPFVDAISISVIANDSIRIHVYEKALAGYVCYLDHYVYFDKDGYVVESSGILTPGIPQVTGITFNSVEIGKKLGESDNVLFARTLDLTKLMAKYDLVVDRIYFHEDEKITLYFGNVRVNLGNESAHLEDKIMDLPQFLSHLEGMSGVLNMEEYDETNGMYIFTIDSE